MKRLVFCLLCSLGFLPFVVFSQGLGLSQDQIELDIRPLVVQPNRPVDITLRSNSTDINRSQVSLYVDGILVEQGVGRKQFSLNAPGVGEQTTIQVIVQTIDQGTVTKEVVLSPAQVDLLYEAINSYTVPFYQGKKLPAHEGGVRVVALPYMVTPGGQKLDPKSLIYTWRIDDVVQQSDSGYGKDSIVFEGSPYYRTRTVSVQVESIDQELAANRTIALPAFDPVIRFYEEHPLWGTDFSRAIVADEPLLLNVPELEVRAVPFFVSSAESSREVTYDWRMNGAPMTTFGDRNLINLRAPAEGSGQSEIDLKITHNSKILQIAHSAFNVVFGEQAQEQRRQQTGSNSGSNFFGTSN